MNIRWWRNRIETYADDVVVDWVGLLQRFSRISAWLPAAWWWWLKLAEWDSWLGRASSVQMPIHFTESSFKRFSFSRPDWHGNIIIDGYINYAITPRCERKRRNREINRKWKIIPFENGLNGREGIRPWSLLGGSRKTLNLKNEIKIKCWS